MTQDTSKKPFYSAVFGIDSSENFYNGFTFGDHWNGWATPFFTKETAESVLKDCKGDPSWRYDSSSDSFVIRFSDCDGSEEECNESINGQDITVNGESFHVYPIGAWSWIWDEYTAEEAEDIKTRLLAYKQTIYVVIENTEGYMPDNVGYFSDKETAESYARDIAEEAEEADYDVTGDPENGFTMTPNWSDHPLDNLVTINESTLAELGVSMHEFENDGLDRTLERLNSI